MITTDDLFLEITDGTTTGSGYFDRLMKSAYGHINEMFLANNLSGTDKANVYMQAMTTILQSSTQFALNAQIQQYQIEGLIKDNLVKDQQVIESRYNVDFMLPKQLEKITAEITGIVKDNLVKEQQILESVYNVEFMLPKQLEKITSEISGIVKDNLVKDQQILESVYNVDFMLPKQLDKITAEINMAEAQKAEVVDNTIRMGAKLSDDLVTSGKERLVIDADISMKKKQELEIDQQILTAEQAVLKSVYEVLTLLPDQHDTNLKQIEAITKDINVKERSMLVDEAQSLQDLANKDSQKAMIDQQKLTEVQGTAKALYEVSNILPKEMEKIISERLAVETTSYIQRLEEGHKLSTVARATLDKVAPVITEFNLDIPVGL